MWFQEEGRVYRVSLCWGYGQGGALDMYKTTWGTGEIGRVRGRLLIRVAVCLALQSSLTAPESRNLHANKCQDELACLEYWVRARAES